MAGNRKASSHRAARRAARVAGIGVLAAVVGTVAYLYVLDQSITSTFEGRRWSVPAKVYAEPLEIFAGRRLTRRALIVELERVGYSSSTSGPGSYATSANGVLVHLRGFQFADGARQGTTIEIKFSGAYVSALSGGGEPLDFIRLEPPVIGSFYTNLGEDRLVVPPENTPVLLTDTLKAVEDQNFDNHHGFDPAGIARAFWVNLREQELLQGGSTLTQQLVKSYFLSSDRTVARKLRELAMAVILEIRFDKADLLNAYVNEIYLGQDGSRAIHGFGLGSQFYLNKPLREARYDEIALLVAIIRGPSYYNPMKHPERAKARRDLVLSKMLSAGLISEPEFDTGFESPIRLASKQRGGGAYYPAYMELVRNQLDANYDLKTLSTRGYSVFTTLVPHLQDTAQTALTDTLTRIERERGLDEASLQGAMVVRNAQTGAVEALVGGRDAGSEGFNRALHARRQVGSLIKPVVYLAALETGRYHLASMVEDTPLTLHEFADWSPENFDRQFHGSVPLVRALGDSLNVATVRLGLDVGVAQIARRFADLTGLPQPQPYPAMLLGAVDLTPFDVSNLYAIFAGGGFVTPAQAVSAVLDEGGEMLARYPIDVRQAIDPYHAGAVTRALQVGMKFGTGQSSIHADKGVAGKTGTSDAYRDSWFAAFDERHLAVVWVGRDDNAPHGLTGSRGALQVWDAFATQNALTPVVPALGGGDHVWVGVDYESGKRAFADCGDPVSLPLPKSVTLPRKPGCGISLQDFGDKVRDWFKGS